MLGMLSATGHSNYMTKAVDSWILYSLFMIINPLAISPWFSSLKGTIVFNFTTGFTVQFLQTVKPHPIFFFFFQNTAFLRTWKSLLITLWRKRENAGNQHFLFFPTMFSVRPKKIPHLNNSKIVVCPCFEFGHGYFFRLVQD